MDFFQRLPIEIFPQSLPGIVEEAIAPTQPGRVRLRGVSWAARLATDSAFNLTVHQPVAVVGRQGNTLLVQPQAD